MPSLANKADGRSRPPPPIVALCFLDFTVIYTALVACDNVVESKSACLICGEHGLGKVESLLPIFRRKEMGYTSGFPFCLL